MTTPFPPPSGYPAHPYGAPPAPMPTPGHGQPPGAKLNLFAVLSVPFALLSPPAGAVLGHLGLGRIKRTGERGRTLALVGVVLSYLLCVALVVGLVLWLTRAEGDQPAADTTTAADGGSVSSTSPDAALLDGDELGALLNQPFGDRYSTPVTGGQHGLEDFKTADPNHAKCTGVVYPRARSTYRDLPVQTYAFQRWSTPIGSGTVMFVEEAAVAMDSAADAQQVLQRAITEWRECDGITFDALTSDGRPDAPQPIKDVRVTDSMITAIVGNVQSARALSVKNNFVVESVVVMDKWSTPRAGSATIETAGSDVVTAIRDKIN